MLPTDVLKQYFGYDTFRPPQGEIINAVLEHQSVVAILPTGTGKSLCFQIPALLLPKITLVISPLIALMEDQVNHLNEAKIPATFINSSLSKEERTKRETEILENRYKLVYSTPERLKQPEFIQLLNKVGVSLVVIDEAHCISEWGHDFRPEYRKIVKNIAKLSTKPKIAAFTATATKQTLQDILSILDLNDPQVFSVSPLRTNLSLNVIPCNTAAEQEIHLLRILDKFQNQSGIIYCATRRKVEELKQFIDFYKPELAKFTDYYHGGMKAEDRAKVQANFASDKTKIILATNAFGMGIDKANIRFVVHWHPPASIEHYYQEVGRGGRDRESAECFLLLLERSFQVVADIALSNPLTFKHQQQKLQSLYNFLLSQICRTAQIGQYFTEEKSLACENCDNCQRKMFFPSLTRTLWNKTEKERIQALLFWRSEYGKHIQTSPYLILTDLQLLFIANLFPRTENELLITPGIGLGWIESHGSVYLESMVQ
ncbi:MAG: hypothetical protein COY80_00875 [Candidatus Pacebacteria bacterium CG_4_10_14_0_8_um_filter_42_14]|nr:MAG: hypothetical protein COY80_00875 [Candidatus Pacebacteria bacterium CG_4_10_14_0_8_um_filter_42_14]